MINYLIVLCVVVAAAGFAITLSMIRKQEKREYDKGTNETTARHVILANPMLWAYVLFPIAIVLGAALLIYLYW